MSLFITSLIATYILLLGVLNYIADILYALTPDTLTWRFRLLIPFILPFKMPWIVFVEFALFVFVSLMLLQGQRRRRIRPAEPIKEDPNRNG